jgi:hypothetical protein
MREEFSEMTELRAAVVEKCLENGGFVGRVTENSFLGMHGD